MQAFYSGPSKVLLTKGVTMFHVGQKVVCVKDDDWGYCNPKEWNFPVKGNIYHIRSIGPSTPTQTKLYGLENCVRLMEIKNKNDRSGQEPGFNINRFRPLQEKSTETGMEILRKLLDPANHKELVE